MIIELNDWVFGSNVRYLRMKSRLSQKALAAQLGISVYTLRDMEQGAPRIHFTVLHRLCEIFRVSPEDIVHSRLEQKK